MPLSTSICCAHHWTFCYKNNSSRPSCCTCPVVRKKRCSQRFCPGASWSPSGIVLSQGVVLLGYLSGSCSQFSPLNEAVHLCLHSQEAGRRSRLAWVCKQKLGSPQIPDFLETDPSSDGICELQLKPGLPPWARAWLRSLLTCMFTSVSKFICGLQHCVSQRDDV